LFISFSGEYKKSILGGTQVPPYTLLPFGKYNFLSFYSNENFYDFLYKLVILNDHRLFYPEGQEGVRGNLGSP
jgi:hypothetical protein